MEEDTDALVRSMVDATPVPMFVKTAALRYRYANAAMLELVGRRHHELVGRSVFDVFPDQASALSELEFDVLATGRARTREVELDLEGVGRRVFEDAVFRLDVDGETCLGVVRIDVTASALLRAEREQRDRLSALGRLSGSIAHDFGEALKMIAAATELLDAKASPEEIEHARAAILESAGQASELVDGLRQFVREAPAADQEADVAGLLRTQLELLRRTLDPRIALRHEATGDLPPVRLEPAKFAQILTNLCINAVHAIDGDGEILVTAERVPAADLGAWILLEESISHPDRDHVGIRVRDTGRGMDARTRVHAFEPFYSTKGERGGTGLGLSMVYGIVKQHEGAIELESEPGRGTEVRILLPIARGPEPSRAG